MKHIEEKLVNLLEELIDDYRVKLKNGELNASDRKVIVELLKNNGITIDLKKGNPLSFLTEDLPFDSDHMEIN